MHYTFYAESRDRCKEVIIELFVEEIKWRKLQSKIGGNCRTERSGFRAVKEAFFPCLTRNSAVLRRVTNGLQ